ncbi:MAG: hypothetical protein IIC74_09170 [Bacteroidetes bacterium]|nr:hypothetical protein [Bacteroidota bacterium]
MNTKLIMSLDQGTTSSRAVLFNHKGEPVEIAQQDFEQIFPQPGWVEHNPIEIWESQISSAKKVLNLADASNQEVVAIGITNQRETTIVWNKNIQRQLPVIIADTISVEPIQNKNPETGTPLTTSPKKLGCPSQFCNNPPINCRLATNAATKITGITDA